jgi:sugar porter (SP) family MFS transporter
MGLIFGYDLGSIAGALLFITKEFSLATPFLQETLTVSVAAGMVLGGLLGGRLCDVLGRKRTMLNVALGYALFAILSGVAQTLLWLDLARFLLGICIGLSMVATTLFIAELAPSNSRGAMVVVYQIAIVVGIIVSYLADYGLAASASWRVMLALSAAPALLVFGLLLRLPDTPRWYILRGQPDRARRVLHYTNPTENPDHVVAGIQAGIAGRQGASVTDMLSPPFSRATGFVLIVGFLSQITGINAVTYFSPMIFQSMGFTGYFALLLVPAFIEIAALVATIIAMLTIDRLGRRPTLLTGIAVMAASNALLVALFATHDFTGAGAVLGFLGILFFTMGYNFGFGTVVWIYAGEAFPARLRALGSSATLSADLIGNLLLTLFFLLALKAIGGAATFGVFLLLTIFIGVYVYRVAPETKGKPLETIRYYWENNGQWPEERASHCNDA